MTGNKIYYLKYTLGSRVCEEYFIHPLDRAKAKDSLLQDSQFNRVNLCFNESKDIPLAEALDKITVKQLFTINPDLRTLLVPYL